MCVIITVKRYSKLINVMIQIAVSIVMELLCRFIPSVNDLWCVSDDEEIEIDPVEIGNKSCVTRFIKKMFAIVSITLYTVGHLFFELTGWFTSKLIFIWAYCIFLNPDHDEGILSGA